MPRLSVITPTYNQAEFIEDTIKSVLSQSFEDFEYIIVDSCSDDGTEEIVRKYEKKDPRILYIREKDRGQADGINKGLRRAKGDVVCWINSDDMYFDKNVFKKAIKAFESRGAGLVLGDAWYCDREGKFTEYSPSDRKGGDWLIKRWYYIVQPSCFWINRGKLLDTSYDFAFDWKFFAGLFDTEKKVFIHEPLSIYRMYDDNKTGLDNAARRKEIWRLKDEFASSKADIYWSRELYRIYKKAEKTGNDGLKRRADLISRILFHISGRRIAGF